MPNPFMPTAVVGDEAFCNRTAELKDLRKSVDAHDRVLMYGERRIGKTSLVRKLIADLPEKKYVAAYVDLWQTDNSSDFVRAVAKGITLAMSTRVERLYEHATRLFGYLKPAVTFDDTGKPTITFGASPIPDPTPDLERILAIPQRIAEESGKTVLVVFDEFQQIMEYESDLVERQLRSLIQFQPQVSYLFLGSRRHLITGMFEEHRRPLYKSATHYPIGAIEERHWIPFVAHLFEKTDRHIENGAVRTLVHETGGHPFYMQRACSLFWEQCDPGQTAMEANVPEILTQLLAREANTYTTIWESITSNQRKLLKMLAAADGPSRLTSAPLLNAFGLNTPSNAQRAAKSLMLRDQIDREENRYFIQDRFFRLWIRRRILF